MMNPFPDDHPHAAPTPANEAAPKAALRASLRAAVAELRTRDSTAFLAWCLLPPSRQPLILALFCLALDWETLARKASDGEGAPAHLLRWRWQWDQLVRLNPDPMGSPDPPGVPCSPGPAIESAAQGFGRVAGAPAWLLLEAALKDQPQDARRMICGRLAEVLDGIGDALTSEARSTDPVLMVWRAVLGLVAQEMPARPDCPARPGAVGDWITAVARARSGAEPAQGLAELRSPRAAKVLGVVRPRWWWLAAFARGVRRSTVRRLALGRGRQKS